MGAIFIDRFRADSIRLETTHGTGTTGIEVLVERHLFAADTIAITPLGTAQDNPFVIVINRHIGRGIHRQFVVFVIRTRNGHFTIQVDARTVCREVATVKLVICPTVVKGEVISGKTAGISRLSHRLKITIHRNLRLHVGQFVMYITQTRTQRIVFVNREAERYVSTITFVGIVGQVCIIRFKVVIEDATAKAHTVNGEVRVGDR